MPGKRRSEKEETAIAAAMEAQAMARNNVLSLQGCQSALKSALEQVEGQTGERFGASWSGVVTLHDKRIVDCGVFVKVRPQPDPELDLGAEQEKRGR